MADALTQKDIDSLLKGATAAPAGGAASTSGVAPVASPAAAGPLVDAMPYNFRRPPRISRDRQATLDAVYGRFALSLQSMLSSRLRTPTDIVISSVEQATFAEFTFSLANPCAAFVFNLQEDEPAAGVIDLGTDLTFYLVDRLFGGPGDALEANRAATPLERMVVKGVTEKILELLAEAWEDYLRIAPTEVIFESTPDAMQVVSREDNVLVANLEVRSGSFSGWLSICIPLIALEPFLQEKPAVSASKVTQSPALRQVHRAAIEQSLRASTAPVAVRFPAFRLSTLELSSLRIDQVVHTGHALGAPVEIHVNDRPQFAGTVGQARRHISVQIQEFIRDISTDPTHRAPRGRVL